MCILVCVRLFYVHLILYFIMHQIYILQGIWLQYIVHITIYYTCNHCSVQKNQSGEILVSSHVFKITASVSINLTYSGMIEKGRIVVETILTMRNIFFRSVHNDCL